MRVGSRKGVARGRDREICTEWLDNTRFVGTILASGSAMLSPSTANIDYAYKFTGKLMSIMSIGARGVSCHPRQRRTFPVKTTVETGFDLGEDENERLSCPEQCQWSLSQGNYVSNKHPHCAIWARTRHVYHDASRIPVHTYFISLSMILRYLFYLRKNFTIAVIMYYISATHYAYLLVGLTKLTLFFYSWRQTKLCWNIH